RRRGDLARVEEALDEGVRGIRQLLHRRDPAARGDVGDRAVVGLAAHKDARILAQGGVDRLRQGRVVATLLLPGDELDQLVASQADRRGRGEEAALEAGQAEDLFGEVALLVRPLERHVALRLLHALCAPVTLLARLRSQLPSRHGGRLPWPLARRATPAGAARPSRRASAA